MTQQPSYVQLLKCSHSEVARLVFPLLIAFGIIDFRRKWCGTLWKPTDFHGGKIIRAITGKLRCSLGKDKWLGVEINMVMLGFQPSVPKFLALFREHIDWWLIDFWHKGSMGIDELWLSSLLSSKENQIGDFGSPLLWSLLTSIRLCPTVIF